MRYYAHHFHQFFIQLEETRTLNNVNIEQARLSERLKACNEYEAKLKSWESRLEAHASVMKEREKEINARELRIIERM